MKWIILLLMIVTMSFSEKVKVAIHDFPPCIMGEDGFDIDVWKYVANDLDIDYEFVHIDKFKDIIPGIRDGVYDIAIAGITINDERETIIDFSHPYMRSGLGILVNKEKKWGAVYTVVEFIKNTWKDLVTFFIFMILCAIIMWYLERGKKSFNDKPVQGIGDAAYWANTTITSTGYGDKTPLTPQGKVFAVIVMYVGIYFMAPYITAKMSHMMNTESMKYSVNNSNDLRDKRVATVKSTTSVESLYKIGAKTIEYDNIDQCYISLKNKNVDAVVFDMPVLNYLTQKNNDNIVMIKDIFDYQYYGIALKEGSPLREKINISLLKLTKSDDYNRLYNKWFK